MLYYFENYKRGGAGGRAHRNLNQTAPLMACQTLNDQSYSLSNIYSSTEHNSLVIHEILILM